MEFVEMNKPEGVQLCKEAHKVNGIIPQITNIEFDGMTCECKKFLYKKELCGCSIPHYELKQYENPSYVPANA